MLKISDEKTIYAAFQIALFEINQQNANKYYKSKYVPLVCSQIKTKFTGEELVLLFSNNMIFAIDYKNNSQKILKKVDDYYLSLKKDFSSFDEAVDYIKKIIQKQVLKQK